MRIVKHSVAAMVVAISLALSSIESVAFASSDLVFRLYAAQSMQENMNQNTNLGYLFAIYIITWAGFFAYVFVLSRRQRSLERQINILKNRLTEKISNEKG